MKRNGRYLALTLLAALLPATGRAQPAVSQQSTTTAGLFFQDRDAPEVFSWNLREDLEAGGYPDGSLLGNLYISAPGDRIRIALRPWEAAITGNQQDGFVVRDRDSAAHTVTFVLQDEGIGDGSSTWQDGWMYLTQTSVHDGTGVGVAALVLKGYQTLVAGHYPLVLEAGTWTP